jgi:hypothetical protein
MLSHPFPTVDEGLKEENHAHVTFVGVGSSAYLPPPHPSANTARVTYLTSHILYITLSSLCIEGRDFPIF